jgi:photosystem II stability/assembly factor-like uncharacterized protein
MVFALICANAASASAQQWQSVGTIPFSGWLVDMQFVDRVHGFALDSRGGLFRTASGGRVWERAAAPTPSIATQLAFVDSAVGIMVCDSSGPDFTWFLNVYRTTDAGDTWALVYQEADSGHRAGRAWDAAVIAPNLIALSGTAAVYISRDMGATWSRMATPAKIGGAQAEDWNCLDVSDERIWIGGESSRTCWVSLDGGANWSSRLSLEYPPHGIALGENVVLVAERVRVHVSYDDGDTWQTYPVDRDRFPGALLDNIVVLGDGSALLTAGSRVLRMSPLGEFEDTRLPRAPNQSLGQLSSPASGECWVVNASTGEVFYYVGRVGAAPGAPQAQRFVKTDDAARRLIIRGDVGTNELDVVICNLRGDIVNACVERDDATEVRVDLGSLNAGYYVCRVGNESFAFWVR